MKSNFDFLGCFRATSDVELEWAGLKPKSSGFQALRLAKKPLPEARAQFRAYKNTTFYYLGLILCKASEVL